MLMFTHLSTALSNFKGSLALKPMKEDGGREIPSCVERMEGGREVPSCVERNAVLENSLHYLVSQHPATSHSTSHPAECSTNPRRVLQGAVRPQDKGSLIPRSI